MEVTNLRLDAIDALSSAISRQPGLITGAYHFDGGVCAIGSLGCNDDGKYTFERKCAAENYLKFDTYNGGGADVIVKNDSFVGTPQERKQHMIDWLHEQRNYKCCDWVPAPIERVNRKPVKSTVTTH